MAQGMFEGIWLTRTLRELRISIEKPMKMFCDKQSAISIAKNLVHHDRTKPMEIDHHFIKEKIEEGINSASIHTNMPSNSKYPHQSSTKDQL